MEEEVRRRFEKIEAILQTVAERQAAADVRMDRVEVRMDRTEARAQVRMDRADARTQELEARFEKRFEKLLKLGTKEMIELRRLHRDNEHKINALIDSQQRTEATLRAFLKRTGNGDHGRSR